MPRDTSHKQMVQSRLVRNVTIRLTDERDRLLSLNGLHWMVRVFGTVIPAVQFAVN